MRYRKGDSGAKRDESFMDIC
jgi:hypothetical protein